MPSYTVIQDVRSQAGWPAAGMAARYQVGKSIEYALESTMEATSVQQCNATARVSYLRLKRLFDIVVAAILLIVLLPFLAVIALLVRLTSPGPALFSQRRTGQGGRTFIMYKFRSMVVDADPKIHEEFVLRYMSGQALADGNCHTPFKLVGDPRVTRLGALLRRTSIDELPQLFNVIRGDMSLVGPRPALPYEVQHYTPIEALRLSVPQGMTGLWQVKGRSRVLYKDALGLDLEYAQRCSFGLDCQILVSTIWVVLSMAGGA